MTISRKSAHLIVVLFVVVPMFCGCAVILYFFWLVLPTWVFALLVSAVVALEAVDIRRQLRNVRSPKFEEMHEEP
jgi:hypothetical protein